LITPVIDSPCRSTKPFMAAPSLWFTGSSGWRSWLSKSNPDHPGAAAFGCGRRPRYGFSYQDMLFNTLGVAAGYLLWSYPELSRKIDLRVEYNRWIQVP
jgi:hypothetical protein